MPRKPATLAIDAALEPFADKNLDAIFQIDSRHSDRITSRESSWLEFKENFNWASWERYGRTLAAFANNQGGYLVFGVGNRPRQLLGMTNTNFEDTTPEQITSVLNSVFSPELKWSAKTHEMRGKPFGILYVGECSAKPVIAKKTIRDGRDVKEGEIYYRYRAKSERIRYAELAGLIEVRQKQILDSWMKFIERAARVGVENAALIDLLEGTISGPGGTLLISEELIEKIKFIREGHFTPNEGAPTLRLIGDVETVDANLIRPTKLVDKHIGINMPDIIHAFLCQIKVNNPREYIKQMCFETSWYLPIYYFMRLAKLSDSDTASLLRNQQSRSQSRDKLIGRLSTDNAGDKLSPSTTHPSGIKTRRYYQQLLDKTVDQNLDMSEIQYALRAMRMLDQGEIQPDYIFPILQTWFDNYYVDKAINLAHELSRAICYLDFVLFKQEDSLTN